MVKHIVMWKFKEGVSDADRLKMKQKLEAEFESKGITILSAGPGRLEVPEEVVEQLKSNWQTEWQQRIKEIEAATENAAMKRLKLAGQLSYLS